MCHPVHSRTRRCRSSRSCSRSRMPGGRSSPSCSSSARGPPIARSSSSWWLRPRRESTSGTPQALDSRTAAAEHPPAATAECHSRTAVEVRLPSWESRADPVRHNRRPRRATPRSDRSTLVEQRAHRYRLSRTVERRGAVSACERWRRGAVGPIVSVGRWIASLAHLCVGHRPHARKPRPPRARHRDLSARDDGEPR